MTEKAEQGAERHPTVEGQSGSAVAMRKDQQTAPPMERIVHGWDVATATDQLPHSPGENEEKPGAIRMLQRDMLFVIASRLKRAKDR